MTRRSYRWRQKWHAKPPAAPKSQAEQHLAQIERRWNQLIPTCALLIQRAGEHIRYLHPTKGWRHIHKRRFFGADALLAA